MQCTYITVYSVSGWCTYQLEAHATPTFKRVTRQMSMAEYVIVFSIFKSRPCKFWRYVLITIKLGMIITSSNLPDTFVNAE